LVGWGKAGNCAAVVLSTPVLLAKVSRAGSSGSGDAMGAGSGRAWVRPSSRSSCLLFHLKRKANLY